MVDRKMAGGGKRFVHEEHPLFKYSQNHKLLIPGLDKSISEEFSIIKSIDDGLFEYFSKDEYLMVKPIKPLPIQTLGIEKVIEFDECLVIATFKDRLTQKILKFKHNHITINNSEGMKKSLNSEDDFIILGIIKIKLEINEG